MTHDTHFPTLRRLMLWLALMAFPAMLCAQHKMVGRVVDATTGERLSYVMFYVASGHGTLSNFEGNYSLSVGPNDSVTITHVGYEKMRLKGDQLPDVVRMRPMVSEMSELVVNPIDPDTILKKVITRLNQEYKEHKNDSCVYFMRTVYWDETGSELVEAFANAGNAVNLRHIAIVSGIKNLGDGKEHGYQEVISTNVHRILECGPRTFDSRFWEVKVVPLNHYKKSKDYYDSEAYLLHGADGQNIYRIVLSYNHKSTQGTPRVPLLEGTLYVRARGYALLRFDGKMVGQYMKAGNVRDTMNMDIHIQYGHERGFTEVSHIAANGVHPKMQFRSLLFNLNTVADENVNSVASSNLLFAVQAAGYDSELWEKYDIVRRTKEEEEIAFGKERPHLPD